MMHRGYLAVWRKIEDHPFAKEKREYSKYEAWLDILMQAQHDEAPQQVIIGMSALTCNYGESLKSINTWARRWQWTESKVRRFFSLLKKLSQISTKSEGKTTRLTVLNYKQYDPRATMVTERERSGNDEVTTTDKNAKKEKKEIYCRVVDYLNKKTGAKYKPTTKATRNLIKARLNEGFQPEDFKTVIDNQCAKWRTDPDMIDYLRPTTLFGPKFESYLNTPQPLNGDTQSIETQQSLEDILS